LVGNYQPEHIFALAQALALYDSYQARINDCDVQIEKTLELLLARLPGVPSTRRFAVHD